MIVCFLGFFQSFIKAYVCKLIQIDLFGFFNYEEFSTQKIVGNRIVSVEFPSC